MCQTMDRIGIATRQEEEVFLVYLVCGSTCSKEGEILSDVDVATWSS